MSNCTFAVYEQLFAAYGPSHQGITFGSEKLELTFLTVVLINITRFLCTFVLCGSTATQRMDPKLTWNSFDKIFEVFFNGAGGLFHTWSFYALDNTIEFVVDFKFRDYGHHDSYTLTVIRINQDRRFFDSGQLRHNLFDVPFGL